MRVLFIDSVHPILWERLSSNNFECVDGTSWSREQVLHQISGYQGVVIRSRFTIDKTFLDAASALQFIARSGAGLENINLDYAKEKGVEVFNSPEGNRDAVAEHALGMILSLFNHLKRADLEVRQGIWLREENRGLELKGKTVGIIGYGVMGTAFAQRLAGFGCKVIAHDKYKTGFGNELVEEVSLEALQEQADVVSLHLPQSAETMHYINEAFINAMHKPFYLINTARGKNISLEALINGLESGKALGACLDVLEVEKKSFEKLSSSDLSPAFQKLIASDKVLLSPHVAGWTEESYVKLSTFLADKILAWYQ